MHLLPGDDPAPTNYTRELPRVESADTLPLAARWRLAIARSGLSATGKHVALTLAITAWDDGTNIEWTVDELAGVCSRKPHTVIRVLAELEEAGWVDRHRTGRRTADRYTLTLPGASTAPRGTTEYCPEGQYSDARVLPREAVLGSPSTAPRDSTRGGYRGGGVVGEVQPPPQAPLRHSQPPIVAPVRDGRPDLDQLVAAIGRRIGLSLRRATGDLAVELDARLAEGWTADDLVRHPAVVGPLPTQPIVNASRLLSRRLAELAAHDPPTAERARRRATVADELAQTPPLHAPDRPPGPTVHLDDLETGS